MVPCLLSQPTVVSTHFWDSGQTPNIQTPHPTPMSYRETPSRPLPTSAFCLSSFIFPSALLGPMTLLNEFDCA